MPLMVVECVLPKRKNIHMQKISREVFIILKTPQKPNARSIILIGKIEFVLYGDIQLT